MRDYQGEEILVIPRELFDELGSFQGIETDTVRYLEAILDPGNNFFMDRGQAEEDPPSGTIPALHTREKRWRKPPPRARLNRDWRTHQPR